MSKEIGMENDVEKYLVLHGFIPCLVVQKVVLASLHSLLPFFFPCLKYVSLTCFLESFPYCLSSFLVCFISFFPPTSFPLYWAISFFASLLPPSFTFQVSLLPCLSTTYSHSTIMVKKSIGNVNQLNPVKCKV